MLHPQPQRGQILTFPSNNEANMTPTKPKRGGYREPADRITITIPNYAKYQGPLKSGNRRQWVRFDRATPNDVGLCRVRAEARWVFVALVMISDEGTLADMTYRDIGKAIDMRPQTVKSAIESLTSEGLLQTEVKRVSNGSQTSFKRKSNESDSQPFEQSANDAGYGALQTDNTEHIYTPHKPPSKSPTKKRFRITETSPEFQAFMAAYPRGENGREAWEEWQAINPDAETVAAIMAGLERWKASARWTDDGGKFIRIAWRWLRDGQWLESPAPAKAPTASGKTWRDTWTEDDLNARYAGMATGTEDLEIEPF